MSTTTLLTPSETLALVTAAQSAPFEDVLDVETGSTRRVYSPTPASERALDLLFRAFMPAVQRAASSSRHLTRPEALSAASEAFTVAVREYLVEHGAFAGVLRSKLWQAVFDADREAAPVVVRENASARFWRVMRAHGHDPAAAYSACLLGDEGMNAQAFLAVLRAVRGAVSFEVMVEEQGGLPALPSTTTPSPEADVATRALVAWLFSGVTDRQEQALRLKNGFGDSATETLLGAVGLHVGEPITDEAVGAALGVSRASAQRAQKDGLATMRAAYSALVAADAL